MWTSYNTEVDDQNPATTIEDRTYQTQVGRRLRERTGIMIGSSRKRQLDHNSLPGRDQLAGFGMGLVYSVAGRTSRGEITTGVVAGTADDEPLTLEVPAGLM